LTVAKKKKVTPKKSAAKPRGRPDPMVALAEAAFAPVADAFATDLIVTRAKMFGALGLRAGERFFAMFYKGRLVLKLPAARVHTLILEKQGVAFDPGHGRIMKEWVAVTTPSGPDWITLAREARAFVDG
jgi:hypothetical protein